MEIYNDERAKDVWNGHSVGTITQGGHVYQVRRPEKPEQYDGLVVRINDVDGIVGVDAVVVGEAESIL